MTPDRPNLARSIVSALQVVAMTDDELATSLAEHEAEILSLAGRIEASRSPENCGPARRALEKLNLHRRWIEREQQARERRLGRELAERMQAEAQVNKLARMRLANTTSAREMEVFKAVAREVLGAEMYDYLWQAVTQRAGQAPQDHQPGSTHGN